ncbi:hydantoinase/oxoprolinase family protein [Pseudorhodoferax sp. Leaf265]|uniref:hydantoinase/oxoprolinase family protein n=1 Tax=Pseudorhodoferax sp. Leaf265 TaxID=1736315 RepID=UPI0006FB19ED|nr:hydantoinase/oxoprolinase family protein [Pseudorhodoferax sp. Leaf265]KQP12380.1 5-oxoprolinase [Pseudorhodoferax sp. Leaf265]
MLASPFRIGVDIGGTFTDLVLVDSRSEIRPFKVPSVRANPADGVLAAVEKAAEYVGCSVGKLLADTELFVHGSTVATNTLLEGKGAKVGLLVTEGFRDSLEFRRGIREDVWDHRKPNPPVLVPRYLRLPVGGRLEADGSERTAFDRDGVLRAAKVFQEEGVAAVAICFMHSYANPAHEQAAKEELQALLPNVWITLSSDVAPVVGEYERCMTTVVNAYVAPRVVPYLSSLSNNLKERGLKRELLMVQSNGGAISIDAVSSSPVTLVLSGPAAGVGSLKFYADDIKAAQLVAIEVGGTSCDVTLMDNGAISMTDQVVIDGYHMAIPAVDILTVGAGGGTIASVDSAGMLKAGPEGAGSTPGPACYGRGGTRPTVTDAQLILGRLKPGPYANGAIVLDLEKARAAVQEHVAGPLGISVEEGAAGIIQLVEQHIQHAVEKATLERGYNPRNFTMVAAGGAGPLHGAASARLVGCGGLYVPRLAGVFCAFGMCNSDIRHDYVRSWLKNLDAPAAQWDAAREVFQAMEAEAVALLASEGFVGKDVKLVRQYDLRYYGQDRTVAVTTSAIDPIEVRQEFEREYVRLYGYAQNNGRIEVVNLRVAGVGKIPPLLSHENARVGEAPMPIEWRQVWVGKKEGFVSVPVYDGRGLSSGQRLAGPAIIEEVTTTIAIGVNDTLEITPAGNYSIRLSYDDASA